MADEEKKTLRSTIVNEWDVKPLTPEAQDVYDSALLKDAISFNKGYTTSLKTWQYTTLTRTTFDRRKRLKSIEPTIGRGGSRKGSGARKQPDIAGQPRKLTIDRNNKKKQRLDCKFALTAKYKQYTFPPSLADVTLELARLGINVDRLRESAAHCFYEQTDKDFGEDTSFIRDLKGKDEYTGQMHRVLFPSKLQRANEPGKGDSKHANLDKVFISKQWVKRQPCLINLERDVRAIADICQKAIITKLLGLGMTVADGYPKLHEMEFLLTPPKAVPQDAHADTRFNMVAILIRLDKGVGKATWTATSDSFLKASLGTEMSELDYEQLPLDSTKV